MLGIGFGLDPMSATTTAFIEGSTVSALSSTIYTTASVTAFTVSNTLSTVDFAVSLVRSVHRKDWHYMDNWYNIRMNKFYKYTLDNTEIIRQKEQQEKDNELNKILEKKVKAAKKNTEEL
ncbi:MAG: hypothetical protein LBV69_00265, partial [Bacteroidales bacterium]|nr:hypothetical protein [Bacteroidales bacterium]